MTKPQLHRHLTTGIFNQLSKILKKLRLSDFFLDRAAGINPAGPRTLRVKQTKIVLFSIASCFLRDQTRLSSSDCRCQRQVNYFLALTGFRVFLESNLLSDALRTIAVRLACSRWDLRNLQAQM